MDAELKRLGKDYVRQEIERCVTQNESKYELRLKYDSKQGMCDDDFIKGLETVKIDMWLW